MVHVQTGSGIDIVIDGESVGLYPHGREIIWLSEPKALCDVLAAEINRLYPAAKQPEQANLGLATTTQLLDEIKARVRMRDGCDNPTVELD